MRICTKKHSVFTAPDVHMHTSLLYIMNIQPGYKAVGHLITSTPVLGGGGGGGEKGGEAVNAYLKRNNKGESGRSKKKKKKAGGGGGGVTLTSSREDWAEFYGCIKRFSNDQSLQWQSLENPSLSLYP